MQDGAILQIDLEQIRRNAIAIKERTGVALFPTLKADAYGLGAGPVARALIGVADSFCVFSIYEAMTLRPQVGANIPIRTMGPAQVTRKPLYDAHNVIACISGSREARAFAGCPSIVAIDTGFGRLAASLNELEELLALSGASEVMTILVGDESLELFEAATRGRKLFRHAAASGQLADPRARFDAVRPGLALYETALRVSCPVAAVSQPARASGYSHFTAGRFGVIMIGYAEGLRPGPCLVDGHPSTVLEVGMQTSCVALENGDDVGATVTLLGESLSAETLAAAWNCRPHEVVTSLARIPRKRYSGIDAESKG